MFSKYLSLASYADCYMCPSFWCLLLTVPFATEAQYHCFLVGLSLLPHLCLLTHFIVPRMSNSHLEI